MFNNLGYTRNLFILPFDHRTSFLKIFSDTDSIIQAKWTIYEAFKKAVSDGIQKDEAAILVDEEYADKIIRDAINQDYNVILTTEKSGQKEFTFEYGDAFEKHIEKYAPFFVKALIHYNPNDDPLSKMRQQQKLEILSNYCHQNSYKFLLEMLVTPTEQQLKDVGGNSDRYDIEVRPNLTVRAMEELQNANVEPDIWKIEGMENQDSYKIVALQAQKGGRENVGIVILGRSENQDRVEKWIKTGKGIKGVIGFAIGRTIFWGPLTEYKNGKITKEQTIEMINNKFTYFYNLFTYHTL